MKSETMKELLVSLGFPVNQGRLRQMASMLTAMMLKAVILARTMDAAALAITAAPARLLRAKKMAEPVFARLESAMRDAVGTLPGAASGLSGWGANTSGASPLSTFQVRVHDRLHQTARTVSTEGYSLATDSRRPGEVPAISDRYDEASASWGRTRAGPDRERWQTAVARITTGISLLQASVKGLTGREPFAFNSKGGLQRVGQRLVTFDTSKNFAVFDTTPNPAVVSAADSATAPWYSPSDLDRDAGMGSPPVDTGMDLRCASVMMRRNPRSVPDDTNTGSKAAGDTILETLRKRACSAAGINPLEAKSAQLTHLSAGLLRRLVMAAFAGYPAAITVAGRVADACLQRLNAVGTLPADNVFRGLNPGNIQRYGRALMPAERPPQVFTTLSPAPPGEPQFYQQNTWHIYGGGDARQVGSEVARRQQSANARLMRGNQTKVG